MKSAGASLQLIALLVLVGAGVVFIPPQIVGYLYIPESASVAYAVSGEILSSYTYLYATSVDLGPQQKGPFKYYKINTSLYFPRPEPRLTPPVVLFNYAILKPLFVNKTSPSSYEVNNMCAVIYGDLGYFTQTTANVLEKNTHYPFLNGSVLMCTFPKYFPGVFPSFSTINFSSWLVTSSYFRPYTENIDQLSSSQKGALSVSAPGNVTEVQLNLSDADLFEPCKYASFPTESGYCNQSASLHVWVAAKCNADSSTSAHKWKYLGTCAIPDQAKFMLCSKPIGFKNCTGGRWKVNSVVLGRDHNYRNSDPAIHWIRLALSNSDLLYVPEPPQQPLVVPAPSVSFALTGAKYTTYLNGVCVDSDEVNKTAQGLTSNTTGVTFTDSCIGSTSVKEYFCTGNNVNYSTLDCGSGKTCIGGACRPTGFQLVSCIDTDNGQNKSKTAVVTVTNSTTFATFQDTCDNLYQYKKVKEYYCTGNPSNQVGTATLDCVNGELCFDGRCVATFDDNFACFDSDNGDTSVQGYVASISPDGQVSAPIVDSCSSSNDVNEFNCGVFHSAAGYKNVPCQNGCIKGACNVTIVYPSLVDSSSLTDNAANAIFDFSPSYAVFKAAGSSSTLQCPSGAGFSGPFTESGRKHCKLSFSNVQPVKFAGWLLSTTSFRFSNGTLVNSPVASKIEVSASDLDVGCTGLMCDLNTLVHVAAEGDCVGAPGAGFASSGWKYFGACSVANNQAEKVCSFSVDADNCPSGKMRVTRVLAARADIADAISDPAVHWIRLIR